MTGNTDYQNVYRYSDNILDIKCKKYNRNWKFFYRPSSLKDKLIKSKLKITFVL